MPKLSARARKIELLLFDVDGVLTDGKLFFLPSRKQNPQGASELHAQGSMEFKGFHAHDGVAIALARMHECQSSNPADFLRTDRGSEANSPGVFSGSL